MPRSYALGGHFEGLIEELVKGGRYNNASEVPTPAHSACRGLRLDRDMPDCLTRAFVLPSSVVEDCSRWQHTQPDPSP
jgi:hypothetical protein